MKKKSLCLVLAMSAMLLLSAGTALSGTILYRFSFTGADLFNQQFVYGADGSSAADNDLYDGARLLRVGTNGNHADAGRTYVQSQHGSFTSRWNTYRDGGYVFDSFNLWGLDGRGAFWGEDFKPLFWYSHEGPSGWSTGYHTWPWGNPPENANTLDFPWWDGGQANGIALGATQSELEALKYSFIIGFDENDMFWGQDTKGNGLLDAPNTLPELTFWFGGYVTQYADDGGYLDYHLYEGNMVLSGTEIPEPSTLALLGVGLLAAGIGFIRRRRAQ